MAYGNVNVPGVSRPELEEVRTLAQDAKNDASSATSASSEALHLCDTLSGIVTGARQGRDVLNAGGQPIQTYAVYIAGECPKPGWELQITYTDLGGKSVSESFTSSNNKWILCKGPNLTIQSEQYMQTFLCSNTVQLLGDGMGSDGVPVRLIKLTGDGWIYVNGSYCLTGDTLVTMADGTEKRLDEICAGDEILSYDWETMLLVPNKVIYTDKDENKSHVCYDKWTFEDGTVIKTVHRHEFYNAEAQRMKYMDEWHIGEHAYRLDGTKVALIAHETVEETVQHYKITGEKGTNYFANGLLTGDRNNPQGIVL